MADPRECLKCVQRIVSVLSVSHAECEVSAKDLAVATEEGVKEERVEKKEVKGIEKKEKREEKEEEEEVKGIEKKEKREEKEEKEEVKGIEKKETKVAQQEEQNAQNLHAVRVTKGSAPSSTKVTTVKHSSVPVPKQHQHHRRDDLSGNQAVAEAMAELKAWKEPRVKIESQLEHKLESMEETTLESTKAELEKKNLESRLDITEHELTNERRKEAKHEQFEKAQAADRAKEKEEDSADEREDMEHGHEKMPARNPAIAGQNQLAKVEEELVAMQKKEAKEHVEVEEEEAQKLDVGLVAVAVVAFVGAAHMLRMYALNYPAETGIIRAWKKGAYVPVHMEMDDEEEPEGGAAPGEENVDKRFSV
jgi:hypothetical protein